MIPPRIISNPSFPNSSFHYSELDFLSCESIKKLQHLTRLDEKITYFRRWQCPLSTIEASYLFSLLLRYDLKVFHRHVYALLMRHCNAHITIDANGETNGQSAKARLKQSQGELESIALQEIRSLTSICQKNLELGASMSEIENTVAALGTITELGEEINTWYPKSEILFFLHTILSIQHASLLERLRVLEHDKSKSLLRENVSSVLHSQQYPLIMYTCKAMNTIISKLSCSDVPEDLLSKIFNYLFEHIILNTHIAAEAKRLGSSIVMQILFTKGIASMEGKSEEVYTFLRESISYCNQIPSSSHPDKEINYFEELVNKTNSNLFGPLFSTSQSIILICLVRGLLLSAPIKILIEGEFSILIDALLPLMIKFGSSPSDGKEQLYAIYAIEQAIDHLNTYLKINNCINSGFERKIIDSLRLTLEIVWNNWENPVTNISDKVREVFKKVLSVHELLSPEAKTSFNLDELCHFLLQTDWNRKGKYLCLNMLLPIIGASKLLQLCPKIFEGVLSVMDNVSIRTPAGQFYVDMASSLYQSMKSGKDTEERTLVHWRHQCINPILDTLYSSSKKIREGIIIYPAHRLFKAYPEIIPYVLTNLLKNIKSSDDKLANISLKAFSHLFMLVKRSSLLKQEAIESYYTYLEDGFIHANQDIRTYSIEAITACTKTSVPPTMNELEMAHRFLDANLNNCPADYRTRLVDIYKKFFSRVRDSSRNIYAKFKKAKEESCLYTQSLPKSKNLEGSRNAYISMMIFIGKTMRSIENSLYPGCPHEKVQIVISIYQQCMTVFKDHAYAMHVFSEDLTSSLAPYSIQPLYSSTLCNIFLNAFFDCWDSIRNQIYDILLEFPAPLPGYESVDRINYMLLNANKLLQRPRLRESDSGALVLRLVFNKYVKQLGWRFEWNENDITICQDESIDRGDAIFQFFESLRRNAVWRLKLIRENIFALSTTHPLVGVLSSLRYTYEDVAHEDQESNLNNWKLFIKNISTLTNEIPEIFLQLLSDSYNNDTDETENHAMTLNQTSTQDGKEQYQVDCRGHVYFGTDSQHSRVEVHSLVVNVWLSIRETAMLMGTFSQKLKLFTNMDGSLSDQCIGDENFFQDMGNLFMHILQNTKHNGVIGKCYSGFGMLCSRLLSCNVPNLAALPGKWVDSLLVRIAQNETSILRRSGGFPFIFSAILKAESTLAPILIKQVMRSLLQMCQTDSVSTRINCLNIIRFLFHDTELGTSTLPFAKDFFIISLEGFSSEHWTIRNSSLMLYSALLQRTVGTIKVRENVQASQNCITSREFFSKYPELKHYMLEQLEIATSQDSPRLHPNLYPILLLLSRLSATVNDDPNDPYSADVFIPLVLRCARSCNFMARTMASRALVPLVSSQTSYEFVLQLFEQLSTSTSTNHAHGLLLQICNFLKSYQFNEDQLQNLLEKLNALPHFFALESPMILKVLGSIIYVMQMLCKHSYSIIQSQTTIANFLQYGSFLKLKKSSKLLGLDVALGTLTKVHLTHLYLIDDYKTLEKTLISIFDHSCTNVVIKALKTLQSFQLREKGIEFTSHLYGAFARFVGKKSVDPEQLKYALQTFKSLCESDTEALKKIGNIDTLWQEMYRLHTTYTSCHIRGYALEMLGVLVGLENGNNASEYFQEFIPLITACCSSAQPKEVRLSCQRAIVSSGALVSSLDAWKCIMVLAQDDSDQVRQETTFGISPNVFKKAKKGQVEYIIDKAYERMSELFASDPNYSEYLWNQILLPANEELPFENISLDLFDTESDNLFEEMKTRVDIARRELMKLPQEHRERKVQVVMDQFNRIERIFQSSDTSNVVNIGGVTYNCDIFVPFYRVLIAAQVALGEVPNEWKIRIKKLFEGDAFIHPMIAEML